MRKYSLYSALMLVVIGSLISWFAQAQAVKQKETVALIVRGVTAKDVSLSAADLEKVPHKSVNLRDEAGENHTYEGVTVGNVLKRAGLDFEADLHGRALTRYLLVEAADKYRVVFSLPEIDPAFTDRQVLLATKRDGKPLTEQEGPCRIIVPDEKRQARWIRQVRILTIVDAVTPSERNKKP